MYFCIVTILSFFSSGFFFFNGVRGVGSLFFSWYDGVLINSNKSLKVNKLMPSRFLSSLLSV